MVYLLVCVVALMITCLCDMVYAPRHYSDVLFSCQEQDSLKTVHHISVVVFGVRTIDQIASCKFPPIDHTSNHRWHKDALVLESIQWSQKSGQRHSLEVKRAIEYIGCVSPPSESFESSSFVLAFKSSIAFHCCNPSQRIQSRPNLPNKSLTSHDGFLNDR